MSACSFARCPGAAEASGETVAGAEDRSEVSAHEAREGRWDGFGGGEPVTSLLPPLTGSCPGSSLRRLNANCRDFTRDGSDPRAPEWVLYGWASKAVARGRKDALGSDQRARCGRAR